MEKQEIIQGVTLGKLPYILLELINNENPDSVDYIIARYILDHMKHLKGASIQEISDACEVSKSTLSRFCRKAGLEDFQEMKEELQAVRLKSPEKFDVPLMSSDGRSYLRRVSEQVARLDEALDYQQIDKLVKEMEERRNIILFGSMQAMNPAVNLQQDMLFSDKVMRVPSRFSLQINAIERARANDLVICFSNSGAFFERLFENQGNMKKLNDLRIWMITGNQNALKLPYINECIVIPDNHSYVSHPLQFDLTARVIAMAYAEYHRKKHH
ncbi:MAG: hypothetical protein LKF53_07060 [Solobacterium sp.]|jgi:DNA-binding MurR/RpiR family transcriptional regulator|nr:hypothetical protein [Solobacterium sp.]MCH4206134.1 hypothetical protein [Solobacterium sp.]MCH4227600.1 hypothetical protein [Solobacterium sp.]MCH4282600.1 hypothetical protein [Solobacterium sp.]